MIEEGDGRAGAHRDGIKGRRKETEMGKVIKRDGNFSPVSRLNEDALKIGKDRLFKDIFIEPEWSFTIKDVEFTGDYEQDLIEFGKALVNLSRLPDYLSVLDAVYIFQDYLQGAMKSYLSGNGNGDEADE